MKMQPPQSSLSRLQGCKPSRNFACFAVLALIFIAPCLAQQAAQDASAQPSVPKPPAVQAVATTTSPVDNQKPSAPQTPKQKQLADDTARLLQLANELKAEMDKSSKDTLSLNVMKKAEQVEKLAHKVRDEMKASMGN
jgi:hypothetical protein